MGFPLRGLNDVLTLYGFRAVNRYTASFTADDSLLFPESWRKSAVAGS
jgi:hypothetical protein